MAEQKFLQQINRGAELTVMPDLRRRSQRRYDVADWQAAYSTIDEFEANVQLPWGTEDPEYTGLRLVSQRIVGQIENPNKNPNDPPPYLLRVYDQLDRNARTQVGKTDISYDQYGRKTVVLLYEQFSDGSTTYTDVVGTSACPADATCILQSFEAPDDGTLIRWKLTYVDSGVLSDMQNLRFGGKVIVRTITSLNEIPATPAGFTLVGPGVEFVEGLPKYVYEFAAAAGSGGTPGTSGEISRSYVNSQNGDDAFNPASPTSATGEVVLTVTYVSPSSVTSNPIPAQSGFVLFALDVDQDTGYNRWVAKYGRGGGDAVNVETTGQADGAIIYTVTEDDMTATTPAYPGTGTAPLIRISHVRNNGFFVNTATYHKLPADQTYKKKVNFTKPGEAVIGGSPIQFTLSSQVTMTLLADVEVTYDTTQITDVPFTVESWATYYESYTPTDTGIAVASSQSLGGYLGGASGTSGTNSIFNGILCDSWSYQLGSSSPSSFSASVHVLDVDNDPYVTATDGTVYYRRTKVSYDFS